MALQQGQTLSFRSEMVLGGQNFASDVLYMALYTGFATLGPTTTEYTAENEVSSDNTNYTAGGNAMTGATVNIDAATNTVYVSFDNVSWPDANFTARGALIYNSSQSNKSVAVLDFGSDKIFSPVSNTVTMPVNSSTTALLRFV